MKVVVDVVDVEKWYWLEVEVFSIHLDKVVEQVRRGFRILRGPRGHLISNTVVIQSSRYLTKLIRPGLPGYHNEVWHPRWALIPVVDLCPQLDGWMGTGEKVDFGTGV